MNNDNISSEYSELLKNFGYLTNMHFLDVSPLTRFGILAERYIYDTVFTGGCMDDIDDLDSLFMSTILEYHIVNKLSITEDIDNIFSDIEAALVDDGINICFNRNYDKKLVAASLNKICSTIDTILESYSFNIMGRYEDETDMSSRCLQNEYSYVKDIVYKTSKNYNVITIISYLRHDHV